MAKRNEADGEGEGDGSITLLRQLLAQMALNMLKLKLDAGSIKKNLHDELERLENMVEAERVALDAEHTLLLAEHVKLVAAQKLPEQTSEPAPTPWVRVSVKWFNRVRGFGFLTEGEGTPDIYLQASTLQRCGIELPGPHTRLDIQIGALGRGREAIEVAYTLGFWRNPCAVCRQGPNSRTSWQPWPCGT